MYVDREMFERVVEYFHQRFQEEVKLDTLNLYSTRITNAGAAKLGEWKALKHVYVAETGVTSAGLAAMQTAAPRLRVDAGGTVAEMQKQAEQRSKQKR